MHPKKNKRPTIRVGDAHPRSVTLPNVGSVRVRDDTRRLRRLLAKDRGKVLFATVARRAGNWWISVTVEAADLHSAYRHRRRAIRDPGRWVGIDRGLFAFAVAATADGKQVARFDADQVPKPLALKLRTLRRLTKSVARKPSGSNNRRNVAARLGRLHNRIANIRTHFLHQVSNELVKTHDRIVIEDLNVRGMLRNRRLARAISDAGWSKFARQLAYKQTWRGGQVLTANRWFASSKTCSRCATVRPVLGLSERTYRCRACGLSIDRDLNAAANLAAWAEKHASV